MVEYVIGGLFLTSSTMERHRIQRNQLLGTLPDSGMLGHYSTPEPDGFYHSANRKYIKNAPHGPGFRP